MPTLQEVRLISMDFQTRGAEDTKRKLDEVGKSHNVISLASEHTARSLATTEKSLDSLQRKLDGTYRAERELEKSTRELNAAFSQGKLSQDRYNELLDLAAVRAGKASASTGLLAGSIKSFGASIALGALAGFTASFAGLDQMVLGVGNRLGELRDRAEQFGASTDLFQGLTAAGIEAGMSSDKLSASLGKLQVELGKSAAGEGDLIERLRAYAPAAAVSIQAASTLEQRLSILARTFAETEDPAKRSALAVAAFGKSGADLGRFFAEAGGSLDDIQNNARAAGLVLSRDLIDRGDEFADRLEKAKAQISTALTPALVVAGEAAATMAERAADFTRAMAQAKAPSWLLKLWNAPNELLASAAEGSNNLQRKYFGSSLSDTLGAATTPDATPDRSWFDAGFKENYSPLVPRPTARPADLGSLSDEAYAKRREEAERNAKALDREQAAYTRATKSVADQTRALDVQAGSYGMTAEAADRFAAVQELSAAATEAGLDPAGKLAEQIDGLADSYARAGTAARAARLGDDLKFEREQMFRDPTEQRVSSSLRSAGIDAGSAEGGALASQIRMNEQLEISRGLASDFGSTLFEGLRSGKDGMDALTGALSRLADRMLDMVLDQALQKLISSLMGGFAGGFSGGGLVRAPSFASGGSFQDRPSGLLNGPGTGTSDSILARVSDKEFIVNAAATSRHRGLLDAINSGVMDRLPRFARGSLRAPTGEHGAEMVGAFPMVGAAT